MGDSLYTQYIRKMVGLLTCMMMWCHASGCVWYSLHTQANEAGWEQSSLGAKYLTGVSFSLSQLQGEFNVEYRGGHGNELEMVYHVCVNVVSIFILALFSSTLTS